MMTDSIFEPQTLDQLHTVHDIMREYRDWLCCYSDNDCTYPPFHMFPNLAEYKTCSG